MSVDTEATYRAAQTAYDGHLAATKALASELGEHRPLTGLRLRLAGLRAAALERKDASPTAEERSVARRIEILEATIAVRAIEGQRLELALEGARNAHQRAALVKARQDELAEYGVGLLGWGLGEMP